MDRDEINGGANDASHTRNVPLLRPEGDTPYSVWRPRMEAYLMRAGIEVRDYKTEADNWAALERAVLADAATQEYEAMMRILHKVKREDEPNEQKETTTVADAAARKLLLAVVTRSRRAYGMIYSALAHDLQLLIAEVPQGYAFGLWTLLEERFQSKTDDNITDVWERFTSMTQEPGEAYDAYYARVEKITALLVGAGQTPPTGLRKGILLYHLQPKYAAARLALQASKLLDNSEDIDWQAVKMFMLDYEREQMRADGPSAMNDAGDRAMAARSSHNSHQRQSHNGGGASGKSRDAFSGKCYNCNEFAGHMSRDCPEPRKGRGGNSGSHHGGGRNKGGRGGKSSSASAQRAESSGDEDSANVGGNHAYSVERIFGLRVMNAYDSLHDDECKEDADDDPTAPMAKPTETLATFSHARTSGVHSGRCAERSVTMARMSSHVPARTILGRGRILPLTDRSHVRTQSSVRVASGDRATSSSGNEPDHSKLDGDIGRACTGAIAPATQRVEFVPTHRAMKTTYADVARMSNGVQHSGTTPERTLLNITKKQAPSANTYKSFGSASDSDSDSPLSHRVAAATTAADNAGGRALKRLKKGDGTPITRKPTDGEAKAAVLDAERKKIAAIRAENEKAQQMRREAREKHDRPRGTTPIDEALRGLDWGLDSMASLHVTPNRKLLTNIHRCAPIPIKVANGAIMMAQWKGSVKLHLKVLGKKSNVNITIDDVHWHESFDANLLSWGVLRDENWKLDSSKDGTRVTTPNGTEVTASTAGRLTILQTAKRPEHVYAARLTTGRVVCTTSSDLVRLHERLGHVGYDRLIEECKAGRTDGVGSIDGLSREHLADAKAQIQACAACIQGKMTRPSLGNRGLDSGRFPGEVLHMDSAQIMLPIDPLTGRKRVEHWMIAAEPNSEARFSSIADTKDELTDKAIGIVLRCQEMTGKRVKTIYCDNGSEFINKKMHAFCLKNGTTIETPPANTPELRGIAERNVRSFKDGARTMLIHAGAPHAKVWRYAAQYQAYLWNRTRIAKATKVTPLEALGGRTPSVLHAGVFGCDAWVHQNKSQRDLTFDAKAQPAIYLGHDDGSHGAIVCLLRSGKVIRTRDVELRETSFAHMHSLGRGNMAAVATQPYQRVFDAADPLVDLPSMSERRAAVPNSAARSAPSSRQGGRFRVDAEDSALDSDSNADDEPRRRSKPSSSRRREHSGESADAGWDVDKIIGKRGAGKKIEYHVQWSGDYEPTWQPKANLAGAAEAVAEFEAANRREDAPKVREASSRELRSARPSTTVEDADDDSDDEPSAHAVMSVLSALRGCKRL